MSGGQANGQVNNGGTGGGRPYIRKPNPQPNGSGKRPVATTPGF